jgi:hypothetical protein
MFIANGQGLIAVIIPRTNAVSNGMFELEAKWCRNSMCNKNKFCPNKRLKALIQQHMATPYG